MSNSAFPAPPPFETSVDAIAGDSEKAAAAETRTRGLRAQVNWRGWCLAVCMLSGAALGGYHYLLRSHSDSAARSNTLAQAQEASAPATEGSSHGASSPKLCNQVAETSPVALQPELVRNASDPDPKIAGPAAQIAASRGRRKMRQEALQFTSPESGANLRMSSPAKQPIGSQRQ